MENKLAFIADVLEFVSFWMVAPEILGESRMRQISRQVIKLEKFMPGMVFGLSGVLVGIAFALAGKRPKSQPEWNRFVMGFMVVYMAVILVYRSGLPTGLTPGFSGLFFRNYLTVSYSGNDFLPRASVYFFWPFF